MTAEQVQELWAYARTWSDMLHKAANHTDQFGERAVYLRLAIELDDVVRAAHTAVNYLKG